MAEAVSVRGVARVFPGQRGQVAVLRGVDLEAAPGESGESPEMEVLEAAAGGRVAVTVVGGEPVCDRTGSGTG